MEQCRAIHAPWHKSCACLRLRVVVVVSLAYVHRHFHSSVNVLAVALRMCRQMYRVYSHNATPVSVAQLLPCVVQWCLVRDVPLLRGLWPTLQLSDSSATRSVFPWSRPAP